MNCRSAQEFLLLEESGDLSARRLARLERHLSTCASCRDARASNRLVLDAVRGSLPSGEPSPAVLARISAAASSRAVRPALVFLPAPARLLAAAALFAVLLAGVYSLVARRETAARMEAEDVVAITAMLGHEPESAPGKDTALTPDEELTILARQLLRLEGLQAEEASLDDLMLSEESAPTDLQSRSASAYRPA